MENNVEKIENAAQVEVSTTWPFKFAAKGKEACSTIFHPSWPRLYLLPMGVHSGICASH
jgi:hypothetical protein